MSFFEKIKRAFKKIKTKIIVFTVMMLIVVLWAGCPFVTAKNAAEAGALIKLGQDPFNNLFWEIFLTKFGAGLLAPWNEIPKCFMPGQIETFLNVLKIVLVIYVLAILIGLMKAIPNHEYENIENGSSDWSEDGEQYKVLNKKKGIVLAEKNYLPTDKRGNVNVLVVRRFWCW